MSLDLHHLSPIAAIDLFVEHYNRAIGSGERHPMEIIHGYGSSGEGGVIRRHLHRLLAAHPEHLTFEPAPGGNPGATIVLPRKPLPSTTSLLASEILEYCQNPKTKEKIAGKFRQHGDAKVIAAISSLQKEGALKMIQKGKHKCFVERKE
ncbi:Smr/MutS family protein [Desulfurispirillum indicum]|uniref:Smr protein/MutS2 n=1 Tax=Desulfurispirillum indicum (strain ATCC BAA-1389 / DSM 22839 / S5) TaxID=653733 RepID=E6W2Y2_DESIS|nr:Smr/MutS family protein [Desulfurispirillum indicum]ADU66807.1 Smr protein/MutS2 [Desulfurispirillum indicum S5]UCZ56127.1 Smr/MutS family protein [Desulfurispirillum indicum]